jgi:hypothetical protein
MNDCARVADRLFDEDARSALLSGAPAPADLAPHIEACAECRRVWNEAAEELGWLAGDLVEASPSRLVSQARSAMRQALPPPALPLIEWRPVIAWGASGVALGVCAAALMHPLLSAFGQTLVVLAAVASSAGTELTLQGLDASSG